MDQIRDDRKRAIAQVRTLLAEHFKNVTSLRVLEAGCGSLSHFDLGPGAHVTGIDISACQLQRNAALRERILGDIQTYPLAADSYDLISCWEVLEHVEHPEAALENFYRALAPGGLLVLAVPNRQSIQGLITRYTPYWVHVWVYRHIFGKQDAGRNDTPPFPTYIRPAIAPDRLRRFADEHRLLPVHHEMYEDVRQKRLRAGWKLAGWRWTAFKHCVRMVSRDRCDAELTDLIMVLQKDHA